MSEQSKACGSCRTAPHGEDGACPKCGWNGARGERRCLRCRALVAPAADLERLKLPGGAGLGVWAVVGWLSGFLGSLAFGFALAAVGSVLMARSMRQRCTGCAAVVPERTLIEGERGELRDRRATLFIRAGLMAAAAAIAGFLWLQNVIARAEGSASPVTAASEATADHADVAALEAAGDADALAALVERQPLQREAAADALGRLGDNAVPALLALLTRADEHGKRAALVVLKRLAPRTERAVGALTSFVQAESSSSLRAQAIGVLAEVGPSARGAVSVLEPLLADYHMAGTAESALLRIAKETDWRARRAALRKK